MINLNKELDIFDTLIKSALQNTDVGFKLADNILNESAKSVDTAKIKAAWNDRIKASQEAYDKSVREHKANASASCDTSTTTQNNSNVKQSLRKVEQMANNIINDFKGTSHYPHDVYTYVDDKKFLCIDIALAGLSKENIIINTEENNLSITFQHTPPTFMESHKTYIHRGISKKQSEMAFVIPKMFDIDSITVNFNNGLLRITIDEAINNVTTKRILIK